MSLFTLDACQAHTFVHAVLPTLSLLLPHHGRQSFALLPYPSATAMHVTSYGQTDLACCRRAKTEVRQMQQGEKSKTQKA